MLWFKFLKVITVQSNFNMLILLSICLISTSGYSVPKTNLEIAYEKIDQEFGPREFFESRLQNFDLRTIRSRSPAFERHRFLQETFSFGYFLNPMDPDAGFYSFRSPEAGTSTLSFSRHSLERSGFYETNPQAGSWVHGLQTPLFQEWIDAHYRYLFSACFKNPESINFGVDIGNQLRDEFRTSSTIVRGENFLEVTHARDRSLMFLFIENAVAIRILLPMSNGVPIMLSNGKLGLSKLTEIDLLKLEQPVAFVRKVQAALLNPSGFASLKTDPLTLDNKEFDRLRFSIPWESAALRAEKKIEK